MIATGGRGGFPDSNIVSTGRITAGAEPADRRRPLTRPSPEPSSYASVSAPEAVRHSCAIEDDHRTPVENPGDPAVDNV